MFIKLEIFFNARVAALCPYRFPDTLKPFKQHCPVFLIFANSRALDQHNFEALCRGLQNSRDFRMLFFVRFAFAQNFDRSLYLCLDALPNRSEDIQMRRWTSSMYIATFLQTSTRSMTSTSNWRTHDENEYVQSK